MQIKKLWKEMHAVGLTTIRVHENVSCICCVAENSVRLAEGNPFQRQERAFPPLTRNETNLLRICVVDDGNSRTGLRFLQQPYPTGTTGETDNFPFRVPYPAMQTKEKYSREREMEPPTLRPTTNHICATGGRESSHIVPLFPENFCHMYECPPESPFGRIKIPTHDADFTRRAHHGGEEEAAASCSVPVCFAQHSEDQAVV
ncbi:MAG: hypothetical protein UY87_C0071G0003 [Candidatus Peribacteria bacterium GW2011_GWC2_54_8]|nr:MAG: hypothetical protein UY87_C0071G0003 [Candidatus Peribacteria bacterium GW2011_GWC2_54_8]